MQQITIEIPLADLPKGTIPLELLSTASTIRFLHLGSDGFVFTCRVPRVEMRKLLRSLKGHYKRIQESKVDVSQEGETMIRISGEWWERDKETTDNQAQLKANQKLRALYLSQTHFLRSPEIRNKCLQVTLVGAPESLKNLLAVTFENAKVSYHITKLCGIEKSNDSPLDTLTVQQMRVLRLAYAEGYYNVPRTVSTERLACLLKMDKGTVGEHLRRAEKNIMEFLMTS